MCWPAGNWSGGRGPGLGSTPTRPNQSEGTGPARRTSARRRRSERDRRLRRESQRSRRRKSRTVPTRRAATTTVGNRARDLCPPRRRRRPKAHKANAKASARGNPSQGCEASRATDADSRESNPCSRTTAAAAWGEDRGPGPGNQALGLVRCPGSSSSRQTEAWLGGLGRSGSRWRKPGKSVSPFVQCGRKRDCSRWWGLGENGGAVSF